MEGHHRGRDGGHGHGGGHHHHAEGRHHHRAPPPPQPGHHHHQRHHPQGHRDHGHHGDGGQQRQHHHQQHPPRPPGHQHPPPPPHHQHQQHHHHGGAPGNGRPPQPQPPPPGRDGIPAKFHSFKMLVDPAIHRGASKMVRYDGLVVPGNPHHVPPTPADPRTRSGGGIGSAANSALWRRLEPMELPVPKMKIDENYVGDPPKVEVAIENLNDNVDRGFLQRLVDKAGPLEEIVIAHHPVSRKHLGIARLVFEEVRSAKECVRILHEKSVMGKPLTCYLDPGGGSFKKLFQELTEEKRPQQQDEQQLPEPPPPPQMPEVAKPPSPQKNDASSWDKRERKSSDSRRRDGRHSTDRDRRRRSGRSGDEHHRDHHRRGSSSRRDDDDEEEDANTYAPPPPPPPPAIAHPPPLPVVAGSAAGDSRYQPTAFDPQYSDPDYWVKQAQMYTANSAGTVHRSASQESDPGGASESAMDGAPPPVLTNAGFPPPPPLPIPPSNFDPDGGGDALDNEVAAAMEAAASASQQQAVTDNNGGGDVDEDDRPAIDLDTRLKMLMKDKTGAMPAFLLDELDGSDSAQEEEQQQAEEVQPESVDPQYLDHQQGAQQQQQPPMQVVFPMQPDEIPLSRAPSPFLSTKEYLQCHTERVAERRRAMELHHAFHMHQQQQQGLYHPYPYHTIPQVPPVKSKRNGNRERRPRSRGSDQMSLSSLSSGENNILEQGPDLSAYYSTPFYQPPPLPGQGWSGGEFDPYAASHGGNPYQRSVLDPATGLPVMQHPGYEGYFPWWEQGQAQPVKRDPRSNIGPLIKESLDVFVNDLKMTLQKDINKKVCETFAFYLYDKWWQEQEQKYKSKMQRQQATKSSERVPSSSLQSSPSVKSSASSRPKDSSNSNVQASTHLDQGDNSNRESSMAKAEDLTALFDKQRETMESVSLMGSIKGPGGAFGMGGSLGFGFRGIIPKLPSFKKKARPKAKEDRRRDYSSDEDKPSSSRRDRKMSDKRRDQERRREDRLERERDKDRRTKDKERDSRSEKDAKDKAKPSSDKTKAENKDKKTLDSIYSALYSDASDGGEGKAKAKSESDSSSPEVGRKADKKKQKKLGSSRSSSEEKSMSSSEESSSSDAEMSSLVSSQSESASSKESSAASSSEVTSSEEEETAVSPKRKKRVASKKSRSTSQSPASVRRSSSSSSRSSASSSGAESDRKEDEEVDVEGTPKASPAVIKDEAEVKKKLMPEALKAEEKDVTFTPPKEPVDRVNGGTPTAKLKIPEESPPHIMDHCYAKPMIAEVKEEPRATHVDDHGYTRQAAEETPKAAAVPAKAAVRRKSSTSAATTPAKPPPAKRSLLINQQQPQMTPAQRAAARKVYKQRSQAQKSEAIFSFREKGLDLEDIAFLKRSHARLMEDGRFPWATDATWHPHPATNLFDPEPAPPPPRKKAKREAEPQTRVHRTGCARSEGFYKMDHKEKLRTKYHLHRDPNAFAGRGASLADGSATKGRLQTAQSLSREARSAQRRQLAILGDELSSQSDLLKFNQLKFRRKQMIFGKSAIHDWGLFAMEAIGADEMVIEYVGHVIRPVVSDVWEKAYERQGIGSSYLFRIDLDYVVDATKRGNLARFINHSCEPNCYAKVITVDQQKKIVIYSKQPIAVGEEITYDYKFPIEDEKIVCLCGSKNCRKYLN